MKLLTKMFLISHHIPVAISNEDSLKFYRTVARIHGFSLERCAFGWVMV